MYSTHLSRYIVEKTLNNRPFFFPSLQSYALPVFFGGVTLTEVNTVSNVKAIAVAYFLNVDEKWKERTGDLWEKGFLEDLKEKAEIYAPDLEVGKN